MARRIRALNDEIDSMEHNLRLGRRRNDSPRSSLTVDFENDVKPMPSLSQDFEPISNAALSFDQLRQERDDAYVEMNELFGRFTAASAEYTQLQSMLDHLVEKKTKMEKKLDRLEAESTMCYECEVFHKYGPRQDMSESTNHDFSVDPEVIELIRQMEEINIESSVPQKNHTEQGTLLEQVEQERDRARHMIELWVAKIAEVRLEAAVISSSIDHERVAYTKVKLAVKQEQEMQKMNAAMCSKCHRLPSDCPPAPAQENLVPRQRGLLGRWLRGSN